MRNRLYFLLFLISFCNGESFANDIDSSSTTAIVLSINSTGTTCGRSNGRIIVTVTGGTAPYSYQLNSNTPQSTGIFLYLFAGMYTITVTDAAAQIATSVVTLTNTFTPPTGVNIQPTYLSGCNTQDASLTLSGVGGTLPYTFSIDHTNFQTSNVFSNLNAGYYYCAVKDANGCESPFVWYTYTLIRENCLINQNGLNLSYTCGPFQSNLGLINVSGGTAPYQYSLDGVNFQSNYLFNPLPAGLYTVIVKDATGAILKYSVALHDACNYPFNVVGIVSPAQCGMNGSITVTASNGMGPYTYSIDGTNFQTSSQFTGLIPSNYTVTVKDADGVTSSKLFIVGDGCLSIATNIVNSTCGNNNGGITVTATSGTPPYQYSLDGVNFITNNQFNNLAAGNYTITVRDATAGISTIPATINNIAGPTISSVIASAADCINNNGTISIGVQGGTSPVQYSINGINFQPGSIFSGLANGSYTTTIKDANGCSTTAAVIVPLNNTLIVNAGNDVTICEGQSGVLAASSNGNNFSWSPSTGLNNSSILSPSINAVINTTYTITATSGVCSKTDMVTVFVNPAPVANAGRDTTICFGTNAQLNGSGGMNYQWTPANYLNSSTISNPVVINPSVGSFGYSLVVEDNNGCSSLGVSSIRVTVIRPYVFAGRDTVILANQAFQLHPADPGNYGFTNYSWSPAFGLNNPNTREPVVMLDKDMTYMLTGKTAAGCTATDEITIKVVKTADIYVPTGFTPNNDRLNDILKAIPIGIREFKNFSIYNRWGQLIFQTNDPTRGWNGMVNGIVQQTGVFVWIAEGISIDGAVIKRKGTVLLIR
jgi:gliding motility-associated-like protein